MVIHVMPYKVVAKGLSDVGLVRQNNEDYWAEMPEQNFFALADGMGGHRAGEVASKEAVTALCEVIKNSTAIEHEELTLEEIHGVLLFAIEQVNEHIYALGHSDENLKGMGTTLCCAYFHPHGLIYGHVGDSRIYRYRNGLLDQLTKDDSLYRELMESGRLNNTNRSEFHYKNIITKAIGTEPFVEPSVHITDIQSQDVYLMCSDGLTDMLSLKEIEGIIKGAPDVTQGVKTLVAFAKEKGGHDNITVILMKVEDLNETKDIFRQ